MCLFQFRTFFNLCSLNLLVYISPNLTHVFKKFCTITLIKHIFSSFCSVATVQLKLTMVTFTNLCCRQPWCENILLLPCWGREKVGQLCLQLMQYFSLDSMICLFQYSLLSSAYELSSFTWSDVDSPTKTFLQQFTFQHNFV